MSEDWTTNSEGRANSSDKFLELKKVIEEIIRHSAFDLIAGRTDRVAGLILAQLAHNHSLAPQARE